jgi:nucleotide-binding universal stress UspA family protein
MNRDSQRSSLRDLSDAFDPHLAVDPEDRPYLLDSYDEEEVTSRRAERPLRRRSQRQGKTNVICVDGSAGADRAFLYATRNLPKDHTLTLVHGIHSWMGSRSDRDQEEIYDLENHYSDLCKSAGRTCKFRHFPYVSTSGFGDQACRIAEDKGATSLVIGRRENVSGMRRTLMGSSSQSVLNYCRVPVTIVGTSTHAVSEQ